MVIQGITLRRPVSVSFKIKKKNLGNKPLNNLSVVRRSQTQDQSNMSVSRPKNEYITMSKSVKALISAQMRICDSI